MRSMTWVDEE